MLNQLKERLTTSITQYKAAPRWRQYTLIVALIFAVIYLLWVILSKAPVPKLDYETTPPAKPIVNAKKVPISGPKIIYVYPKKETVKKLGIDPKTVAPSEEVISATDIKPGKNAKGSRVVTFINNSGHTRTIAKDIPKPFLGFERGNELGIGYGIGSEGETYAVRYRRDILRIKEIYLVGEAEVNHSLDRGTEGKVMGWVTYRW